MSQSLEECLGLETEGQPLARKPRRPPPFPASHDLLGHHPDMASASETRDPQDTA